MLSGVRRALLGGTFDPPHVAHLVAGEAAFRRLGVERVDLIPAGAPWQKEGRGVSGAEDRWEMTRLAVEGVEYFAADDREVRRDGPTYTVDTLASYPAGDELWLVLGADAAAGIRSWHRSSEVLSRARLAVAPRPGTDRKVVEQAVGEAVVWLDVPGMAVSGTMLRARVAAGSSIRFLVPEAVFAYVERRGLYRSGGYEGGRV
jgi:nicotinate-nucleotide adenylyltransferase